MILFLRFSLSLVLTFTLSSCSTEEGAEALATDQTPLSQILPDGAQARSFLGDLLFAPDLSSEARNPLQRNLDAALADLEDAPDDADAIIWVGRRHAYLGDYRGAIAVYTRGMELHPDDARLYRHRGHRYISVRELDHAAADFELAIQLIEGTEDVTEPDGAPNERGIPIGTLHHNIWYHLGLTRYLQGDFEQALVAYQRCLDISTNDDAMISCSYWLYLIHRRLGHEEIAQEIADGISADLELIENFSYFNLLLLFNGHLSVEDVLGPEEDDTTQGVTVMYGVGAWYLLNGNEERAHELFRQILATSSWAPFGYLAAEAEMAALQTDQR